eukprot:9734724-Prorocentrum_lima.AAC.1
MVIPYLGKMPVILHFQGFLKASTIFFTIGVDPNMITPSTYTMKKPNTLLLKLETTFQTILKVGH